MVKRGVALGFLGRFGRSQDLRYLDAALLQSHLQPSYIPEGVKMAAVSLMSEGRPEPGADEYPPVGALIALCAFGLEEFAEHNGADAGSQTLARLLRALEEGEGIDASIVLLMLHAKLLHRSLKDEYGIEAGEAG